MKILEGWSCRSGKAFLPLSEHDETEAALRWETIGFRVLLPGSCKSIRGGAFNYVARYLRVSCRSWILPGDRDYINGFRVLRGAK